MFHKRHRWKEENASEEPSVSVISMSELRATRGRQASSRILFNFCAH